MRRHARLRATALSLTLALVVLVPAGPVVAADPPRRAGAPVARGIRDVPPPVIPHDVEEKQTLCLECHATGTQNAPIVAHPVRAQYCLACHVGQARNAAPFPGRGR